MSFKDMTTSQRFHRLSVFTVHRLTNLVRIFREGHHGCRGYGHTTAKASCSVDCLGCIQWRSSSCVA